ncbi:MAG: mechanosensitive ion channel [Alphaproteobacteria bacterium]|nr:mechanosensitive ion channel [Alphaproteobacteria bacterium]
MAETDQITANFLAMVETNFLIGGILTSVLLVAGLAVLRMALVRLIRGKEELLSKDKRRLITTLKNVVWVVLVVGLIFIWAPEIQTLALSLTAFAVAFVIGIKEWIMQITGGLYRTSTKPFKVGDWITVAGLSGEVMDMDAFAVRLQEVDIAGQTYQFTGRTMLVPNSHFLTNHVDNLNFIKNYVFIDVTLTLEAGEQNPSDVLGTLQEVAQRYFAPLRNEALAFVRKVERKASIDIADPDPQAIFAMEGTHEKYGVRLMVPTKEAVAIRTGITRDVLQYLHDRKVADGPERKKEE